MRQDERFGELRALLQQAPCGEAWWTLERELERWEGEALVQVALPYAQDMLRTWPDALRRSPRWEERLACGEEEPRAALLRALAPATSGAALLALLRSPQLPSIHEVTLTPGEELEAAHIEALASQPAFGALYALRLHSRPVSAAMLAPLIASGRLGALRALIVYGDATLGVEACEALCAGGALRELRLVSRGLDRAGLCALLDTGLLRGLEAVELGDGRFMDEDVPALRRGLDLAQIKRLQLSGPLLTDAGLRALCEGGMLAACEELGLEGCQIGAAGGDFLRGLGALRVLKVRDTGLGARGARAIADSGAFLRELGLERCQIGEEGAQALASSWALWELETLRLDHAGVTAPMLAVLVGAMGAALQELGLSGCPLGVAGAQVLGEASGLTGLLALNMSGCGLGDQGVAELVRGPQLGSLLALNLWDNGLSDAALIAIAQTLWFGRLQALSLRDNPKITQQVGWHALATSLWLDEGLRRRFGWDGARWREPDERGEAAQVAAPVEEEEDVIGGLFDDYRPDYEDDAGEEE
jgi:hypothetical protein